MSVSVPVYLTSQPVVVYMSGRVERLRRDDLQEPQVTGMPVGGMPGKADPDTECSTEYMQG